MAGFVDIGFLLLIFLVVMCVITRQWYVRTAVIIVTVIYYFVGTGLVGQVLAKHLETASTDIEVCASTKATILLGAGTIKTAQGIEPMLSAYDRILTTAQVYNAYHKPIYISGGVTMKNTPSEAEIYAKELIALGVPKDNVILENQSLNTRQNAEYTQALLDDLDSEYCLVTDGLHMARSQIYFNRYHVKTISLASSMPTTQLRWRPTAYNLYVTQRMLHEWFGQVKQKMD